MDLASRSRGIWGAVRTIVVADMVMGVDNVLGVAGAAHGSFTLVVLGLVTSIPIVIWGSRWLLKWVERHPSIVYLGSAVLLFTAAKMIAEEPLAEDATRHPAVRFALYLVVVAGVLWAGFMRNHRHLESRIHARLAQLASLHGPDPSKPHSGGSMNVVLVPVSDLPDSHHAVHRVVDEYARNPDMAIHLLNVRRPLSMRVARMVRRTLREDYHRERGDIALKPARDILDRHRIPYRTHVFVGDAAEVIANEAKRLACDRIVMSTARKGSLTRLLQDSTTERVLSRTGVPVELVVTNAISNLERYGIPAVLGAVAAALIAMLVEG
jgi:nucleotide-binding universal stress UspA family protein/threonine/homoserine/homoserine lactone efflux protein